MSRSSSRRKGSRQYQRLDDVAAPPSKSMTQPFQRLPSSSTSVGQRLPETTRNKPKQPQRTTKTSQKLTLFPEDTPLARRAGDDDELVPEADDLFDQLTQVPPERIGAKLNRKKLPRVSAYCTANAYRLDELLTHLKSRPFISAPKMFDECLYVAVHSAVGQHLPLPTGSTLITSSNHASAPPLQTIFPALHDDIHAHQPSTIDDADAFRAHSEALAKHQRNVGELFYFDYGVVVLWGFNEDEERKILRELKRFEDEPLGMDDMENEEFVFHYNSNYQPRIYNDIITLTNPSNYMAKLTISHAIAQSSKLTLFEGVIEATITATKHIPQTMAETGKVPMSRTAITRKIGQLFIMRINVNLVSNVLDTPEIFWSEPALEPLYQAIRGYLEIGQRVELLNQRVAVISDLLDMLREHLTSSHGEQLEWIVIVLIAFEIIIGIVTICFDYSSYAHGKHSVTH